MSAQPETLFRRYPSPLGPIPVWYSPPKPLSTVDTLRRLDDVPRCSRCRTARDRRACRALALRRDGLDWLRIAREIGYSNGKQAQDMAVAHLLAEVR